MRWKKTGEGKTGEDKMSEDRAGKANGPDAPDAPDAIEQLLGESFRERDLAEGLVERVMSALPPREAMRPVLHPALRAAYGVTAVVFAFAAWSIDLPARLGVSGTAGHVALGVFFFQAAIGAAGLGLALLHCRARCSRTRRWGGGRQSALQE